jgi:hypothetical protein
MALDNQIEGVQITFQVPPPASAVQEIIPNSVLAEVVPVVTSEQNNPGVVSAPPSHSQDTYPYTVADVYTINQRVSQFFPVNAPPKNS